MPRSFYFLASAPEQQRLQQRALQTLLQQSEHLVRWQRLRTACAGFLDFTDDPPLFDEAYTGAVRASQDRFQQLLTAFVNGIPETHRLRYALGPYLRSYIEAEVYRDCGVSDPHPSEQRFVRFLGDATVQEALYERQITRETTAGEIPPHTPGRPPAFATEEEQKYLNIYPSLREEYRLKGEKLTVKIIAARCDISVRSVFTYRRRYPDI